MMKVSGLIIHGMVVVLTLALVAGCDDDGRRRPKTEDNNGGEDAGDVNQPDQGTDPLDPSGLFPDEDVVLTFTYQTRPVAFQVLSHDIYLTQKITKNALIGWKEDFPHDKPDLTNVTNPDMEEYGPIDCAYGCFFDSEGQWLTYREPLDMGNSTAYLVPVGPGFSINMGQARELASGQVGAVRFAGETVVYGMRDGDEGPLTIRAQNLAGDGSDDHLVATLEGMAGFVVDPVRPKVITYSASLSSMTIGIASTDGTPDHAGIYTLGQQGSAGSPYGANEASAISPNGRLLAIVTQSVPADAEVVTRTETRLKTFSTMAGGEGLISIHRIGPHHQGCEMERGPNEYIDVRELAWAPDGRALYMLARSRCPQMYEVPETDILRVNIDGQGNILSLVNVTKNVKDNFPMALPIDSFALSPEGKTIYFAAPPHDRQPDLELYAIAANAEQYSRTFWDKVIRLTNHGQLKVNRIRVWPAN